MDTTPAMLGCEGCSAPAKLAARETPVPAEWGQLLASPATWFQCPQALTVWSGRAQKTQLGPSVVCLVVGRAEGAGQAERGHYDNPEK